MASRIRPSGPGTGDRQARPRRSLPGLKATAQLALLSAPAGLAGPGRGTLAAGRLPSRVGELAEDLAEPLVDCLKDRRPPGEVDVLKGGKPPDGRVDARVTGGDESRPHPF